MLAGAVVMTLTGVAQGSYLNFNHVVNFDQSSFQSFGNTGSTFTGSLTYFADIGPAFEGKLTLILTNTDTLGLGGSITGIAMNCPDYATMSSFVYSENGDFAGNAATEYFTLDTQILPYHLGSFSTVYSVIDNPPGDGNRIWGGIGDGTRGIESGETGTFRWTISTETALSLSVADFLYPNDHYFAMALEVKGVGAGAASDLMGMGVTAVPLPPAMWVGAMGLVGIVVLRRRLLV